MRLPGSAGELSAKQFIRIAPLMYTGGDDIIVKTKALKILSGFNVVRWLMLKPTVIDRCLPFVDWIFSTEDKSEKSKVKQEDPKSGFNIQFIPRYKKLYGPSSGFDNLKMSEFHFSEMYYKELLQAKTENDEITALNKMIAVLYRSLKPGYDKNINAEGDVRVKFNDNLIHHYEKKVAKWPANIKQAIFIWYHECRYQLEKNNPLAFKNYSDFISQFDTGLYGMMRSLAGERLGKISEIEDMYVHHALLEIGLMREEEKYMEDQVKKIKNKK